MDGGLSEVLMDRTGTPSAGAAAVATLDADPAMVLPALAIENVTSGGLLVLFASLSNLSILRASDLRSSS